MANYRYIWEEDKTILEEKNDLTPCDLKGTNDKQ